MSQQAQQQYQQDYDFAAQPQAVQQQKYRDEQEYEDGMYESDDGLNEQQNYWEMLEDDMEDENELVPDYYIDRPPTPEFKPLEKGKDVSTQIVDTELFDFEIEVVPVLQVLVGKTLDQARMELIEDSERKELQEHKKLFVKKRDAELLVTQRMENAFLRRKEERERRDKQHKLRDDQKELAHQKMISRIFSKKALFNMKENALSSLEDIGFLKANIDQNVKKNFLPWLLQESAVYHQQSVSGKVNIEQALQSFKIDAQSEHSKFIQQEIERKKEVLRQRELRRLLLEERKRKKAEWKAKMALKEQREQQLEDLEKNIALQSQKLEHILDADFTDILGDSKQTPVSGIFGGLVGQLWIILGTLNKLATEEQQLLDENINEFIVELIEKKLKFPLVLNLDGEQAEEFNGKIQSFEDNQEFFEEQKENFINEFLENADIYSSFPTLKFLKNKNSLPLASLKPVMRALLTTYLGSLEFKPPQVENVETEKSVHEGDEQPKEEQKEEEKPKEEKKPINENASQVENGSSVAPVKKVEIRFDAMEGFQELKALLRIRIPFLSEEEIQMEKEEEEERLRQEQGEASQEQQPEENENKPSNEGEEEEEKEEKELTEEEKEEIKYAKYDQFVETYNGQGYIKQLKSQQEKSRRKDISQEQGQHFQIAGQNCGVQDEKNELFLRQQLFQILKEKFAAKFGEIEENAFLRQCEEIDAEIINDFANQIPRKEDIAIFDYDAQH